MASSSSSATREALAGYLAGRTPAEQVVAVVAAAYYRGRGREREWLQPVIEVIERAAPGVVDLVGTDGGAGFDIRLAERRFPKQEEARLRAAVAQVLPDLGSDVAAQASAPAPGLLARLLRTVRRFFSASA
jgi:hypothetical protein